MRKVLSTVYGYSKYAYSNLAAIPILSPKESTTFLYFLLFNFASLGLVKCVCKSFTELPDSALALAARCSIKENYKSV